jgi:putative nucleotidyltransferase with HDIG domain
VERQRDELLLILASGAAGAAMRRLDDLGLLSPVLPELDAARGFEQPKEHYWDVFNHLLEAVARMDLLLAPAPPPSPEERWIWEELWEALAWWEDGRRRLEAPVAGAASRAAVLKLAALLHDIGKPATRTYEADGRMRFFGHSAVGARMARRLLRRMRFPRRVIETVCTIIEAHLRPLQMAHYGLPTPRAVYRYFRDTGEAGVDTLFVSLADHLATVGPRISRAAWRRHVAVVNHILRSRYAAPAAAAPSRLVDGHVLMAELGLAPGPLVGELLEAVREAHAAGEVHTRDEAVSLARRRLSEIRAGR